MTHGSPDLKGTPTLTRPPHPSLHTPGNFDLTGPPPERTEAQTNRQQQLGQATPSNNELYERLEQKTNHS